MRFNDREVVKLGETKADLAGILSHMKPQGNEWSDWYQQPSFKERLFKLKGNILFYYRINEIEPAGVLVLENAHVAYERPHKGIPFAFSLTFKVNDRLRDNEGKHIFSCRCDSDVNKWVSALKTASYEYWRSQYVILRTKIAMQTGSDPVLDFLKSESSRPVRSRTQKESKSTFYSSIESSSSICYEFSSSTTQVVSSNGAVDNLITF